MAYYSGSKNRYKLDYKNTCPIIDANLAYLRSDVFDALKESMEDNGVDDLIIGPIADQVLAAIESEIEEVRTTNLKMREAADGQINDLMEQIEALESKLSDKDKEISDLEREIDDLKSQIE